MQRIFNGAKWSFLFATLSSQKKNAAQRRPFEIWCGEGHKTQSQKAINALLIGINLNLY
jgi:hypothetical protein